MLTELTSLLLLLEGGRVKTWLNLGMDSRETSWVINLRNKIEADDVELRAMTTA
jgi:hypothetical protein